ncbi:MAG: hypothetical protein H0W90_13815 [Actinobacteria bacterium]|nr:hypothetical protein [Actinomycetota bacterium]
MLRKRSLCVVLMAVALLTATMPLAVEAATAGGYSNPLDYRYAGVVENGRGIPTHHVKKGEGIVFHFFDAFSQGRKSEPYQLCIGPGKTNVHCWKRTARYGVGKVSFSFVLPPDVPLDALTARWLVAGRTVASWQFFYVRSD